METILCNPARASVLETSRITGIAHSRLYGSTRTIRVVRARWACFLVLRRLGLSFPEIAAEFGKDHTTVIHGVCKGTSLLKTDARFSALVDHLSKHLS